MKNVIDVNGKASYKVAPLTNEAVTNAITCFKSEFEEGDPIEPQVDLSYNKYQRTIFKSSSMYF